MEYFGLKSKLSLLESGLSDENSAHFNVVYNFHKGNSFLVYKNSPVQGKTHKSILTRNVFCVWALHKIVSQILATINFSSGEIARKTLSVGNNFTGTCNINLGQTSHLNLDKFDISNDIPDCQSAPFP